MKHRLNADTQVELSALYYYPVKSCRGIELSQAQIDVRGIVNDRRLMIVDWSGNFLTQRGHPHVALIKAFVEGNRLIMEAPGMPSLIMPYHITGQKVDVTLWEDQCKAIDQGDQIANWLSEYIKVPCRLARISEDYTRQVDQRYAPNAHDQVGFADGFPFLLISQASLDDLNSRLSEKVTMDRFRPNLVVSGCEPFAEDTWKRIRIGDIEFTIVKSCARCVITMIDQQTGVQYKEPLKTLSTYRHVPGKGVLFGQNLTHSKVGSVKIHERVHILEYQTSHETKKLIPIY